MSSPPPLISIPASITTVDVSIIDTSFQLSGLRPSTFIGPEIEGYDNYRANAYAFLITHVDHHTGKDTKFLFDLGPPKDWEYALAPALAQRIKGWGAEINIDVNVSEILESKGVSLSSIDSIIWSHPHWDHIGRPGLFPQSTSLVVGPGVKPVVYPGYPENPTSPLFSREFAGRTVTELDFSASTLKIGGFPAIDFFHDGSFYLLSAPGHATGHINGLARTTTPSDSSEEMGSTFILMGADSYHHPSQLRPHKHSSLPDTIASPIIQGLEAGSCPGEFFEHVHPAAERRKSHIPEHYTPHMTEHHSNTKTTPFFTVSQKPTGETVAFNIQDARATIRSLQAFDADPNILLITAHDRTLAPVLDYFPNMANQWKRHGWKEKGHWRFLDDLWPAMELARNEKNTES